MRVLIADDHELLRDVLKSFLESEGALAVTTASDVAGALKAIAAGPAFDVILLDYTMPGMEGFRGLEQVIAAAGPTPVAIISGTAPGTVAEQALARGARGYVPKTLPARSVLNAIRFMAAGERYLPIELMAARDAPPVFADRLTPRERQVLEGLCDGKANKEIARDLGLSEPTVKLHVKLLCRKLEARNRTHAAMLAKEAGFR